MSTNESKECRRVNVSFKDNERDNKLLSVIKGKNDKSAFVKDCIEFYLNINTDQNIVTNLNKPKSKKVKF